MSRYFCVSVLLAGLVLVATAPLEGQTPRAPVLVELFTSEGCSSCPPADALLTQLDRQQPVPGAQIIVLSEHVDYWNRDGWVDPFSSPAMTRRQEDYAERFGISGPYTPQMVVDGERQFVGNNPQLALAAIRAAAQKQKVAIRLTIAPGSGTVRLETDPLPPGKRHKAGVWVAVAANGGISTVLRGENKGRTLQHVAIVRQLRQAGDISDRAGFFADLSFPPDSRLIVFIQDPGNRQIWGAARFPGIQ